MDGAVAVFDKNVKNTKGDEERLRGNLSDVPSFEIRKVVTDGRCGVVSVVVVNAWDGIAYILSNREERTTSQLLCGGGVIPAE